ncbi:MAG TPA: serine/threonine-protein kinase [Kofleriaceae bacterium]|jgi:hypothetical protein
MGVVYAAYDPDLDRKVALKVVQPRLVTADARDRAIQEARALGKLDHPNIVRLHDVITTEAQLVIVMEWIDGDTLATWEQSSPRSWRDVVAVYAQAADGLAAAHRLGIVHRDFKPTNAIVGRDGRVRVLDFGLAQVTDDAPAAAGRAGTLAYCSPEHLAGDPATALSDQFSFGVALYRALEDVMPFSGSSIDDLRASIAASPATSQPPRALPRWLRAAVLRMLSSSPAARFPSMSAALSVLRRPRGWRRWRVPIVATVLAAIPTTVLLARPATDPLAACDGGASELRALWNPAISASLGSAFPSDTSTRLREGLDAYRDRWSALHRDACLAHRRNEQSDSLLDRRMQCLQQHLGDFRSTVALLTDARPPSADNAVESVVKLPSIEPCSDIEGLQAENPLPTDPSTRMQIVGVRRDLSQAAALDRAGRSDEALVAARAVVDRSHEVGFPPVVVDADLEESRILIARQDPEPAAPLLLEARQIALHHNMFERAREAVARLIFVEGRVAPSDPLHATPSELLRDADIVDELDVSGPTTYFGRALLYNNLGTAFLAAGDRDQALVEFERAASVVASVVEPDLELACIDSNIAMLTHDDREREQRAKSAWVHLRAQLGAFHIQTVGALEGYAHYVHDPALAHTLITEACVGYERFHGDQVYEQANCKTYQTYLAGRIGEHNEYDQLLATLVTTPKGHDDGTDLLVELARDELQINNGQGLTAITSLRAIVAQTLYVENWWERAIGARALYEIARAELLLGDRKAAATDARASAMTYDGVVPHNENVEFRFRRQDSVDLLTKATNDAPHDRD